MADTICIALSAKNQHNPSCSDLGRGWFFALSSEKLQWKESNGLSDKGFEELLKLIKNLLPEDNTLPATTYEAKCNTLI